MKGVLRWWPVTGFTSPVVHRGGSKLLPATCPARHGVNVGHSHVQERPQRHFLSLTTCHSSQRTLSRDSSDDKGSSKKAQNGRGRSNHQPAEASQVSASPSRSYDSARSTPPTRSPRSSPPPAPAPSPSVTPGQSPAVSPTTPLLLFSPGGQLSLAQRPVDKALVPVDLGTVPPLSAGRRHSNSNSNMNAAVQQKQKKREEPISHKDDRAVRPRDKKKPETATAAPKYSKAARRFFNERFREPQRLSKVLAAAGIASRRAAETMIFAGRVTVNGSVCMVPQTAVDPLRDNIYVDGSSLPRKAPPKLYFMVNKPKGYICSAPPAQSNSPQYPDSPDLSAGQNSSSNSAPGVIASATISRSALSLLDGFMRVWEERNEGMPRPRLFTVGRLDVATTGLLLITNDGDFANRVAHPSAGLTKEYVVTVKGRVTRRQVARIAEGTEVDGVHCRPLEVEVLPVEREREREEGEQGEGGSRDRQKLRVTVGEGRNREVRRLMEAVELEVVALKRVRIGSLRLPRELGVGRFKTLSQADAEKIAREKI